jgi:prepilin-type N-terminal cleavage/methylation domain-containing protein
MTNSSFFRKVALRRPRGFTLTEMMLALAIGAVLVGIAAPSFKGTIVRYRMGSESSALLDSLLLARDEARNSASPVSVCASRDGATCNGTAWSDGHIVFRDQGSVGTVDGTDAPISRATEAKSGITIVTTLQQSGAAYTNNYVQFGADGKLNVRTALLFTTCRSGYQPLLTAVQYNGSTSSSKGAGTCP